MTLPRIRDAREGGAGSVGGLSCPHQRERGPRLGMEGFFTGDRIGSARGSAGSRP